MNFWNHWKMKEESLSLFAIVLFITLAIDQYSKYLIQCNMTENETIPFITGVFDITYVRNTGAAFGIFAGKQTMLSIITAVLLVILTVYALSQAKHIPKLETFSLALIVGGGLGNLITRLLYRYVIDFFNFYFWPVFNVADIAICLGCALLIVSVLIIEPKKKQNM